MTTLGDFHQLVRDTFNLDTNLDAFIPSATERAAEWLENNYTYYYMERITKFTLDIDVDFNAKDLPITASAQAKRIKEVISLRPLITGEDGTERLQEPLVQVNPGLFDPDTTEETVVLAYAIQAKDDGGNTKFRLVLMGIPNEDRTYVVTESVFSIWPTDLGAEHFLITNLSGLLLAATAKRIQPFAKDNELVQAMAQLEEVEVKTSITADQSLREAQDRQQAMMFGLNRGRRRRQVGGVDLGGRF